MAYRPQCTRGDYERAFRVADVLTASRRRIELPAGNPTRMLLHEHRIRLAAESVQKALGGSEPVPVSERDLGELLSYLLYRFEPTEFAPDKED
jgi:hypothetical protein